MAADTPSRKLAVILHADVVGSTKLVQRNESIAHERIQGTFHLLSEAIENYGGTVHELRGDALLAEFQRASDAVSSALAFQAVNASHNAALTDDIRPDVRIGISLGEVVIADDTLTGPDVVLAQRLEQLAESGGVCLSQEAYHSVPDRFPFDFENLGEQTLKGFDAPIRAYSVGMRADETIPEPEPKPLAASEKRQWIVGGVVALLVVIAGVLAWLEPWEKSEPAGVSPSENPSIAVLPFQNLGGDGYFSDGITNDLITDLSKFSNLLVISSNTMFTYKGKSVNVKGLGRELGVRYVLEGSIQKADDRVRINAQLIDATTDHHVWADRYEFELDDIFMMQNEIANTVVTSLNVIVTDEEQSRSTRLTEVIEAYDLYLRGRTHLRGTKKTHREARKLFDKAIALDPNFAAAHADKSFTYFSSFIMPMTRDERVMKRSLEAAERGVELDDTLPLAQARLAWAYFANRQHAKAIAAARKAVALGPNDAEAHAQLGNVLNWVGKPEEGKLYIERAIRLNPHHPYYYLFYLGHSYYLLEDRERAIELLQRVVTRAPTFLPVRRHLAVLYTEVGRLEDAKTQTAEVLRIFPGASIEDERSRCYYRWTPELWKRFMQGLLESGMPQGKKGEDPISM